MGVVAAIIGALQVESFSKSAHEFLTVYPRQTLNRTCPVTSNDLESYPSNSREMFAYATGSFQPLCLQHKPLVNRVMID